MIKQIFYVFNGDADGIIATHELRLAHRVQHPISGPSAIFVTGVKRDINLLGRLARDYASSDWPNAEVYVCDVSLDSNAEALYALLDLGATVHYFDHHRATLFRDHPRLHAHINTSAATCTSLIVSAALAGQFHSWAMAAAYGDGVQPVALDEYRPQALADLARVGRSINYNAYGDTVADLHFPPLSVLNALADFVDPLAFLASSDMILKLESGFNDDMAVLAQVAPREISTNCCLWTLPDAAASRRANGSFANQVIAAEPHKAHAILTPFSSGSALAPLQFSVSIRAPKSSQDDTGGRISVGADDVATQFATGGGRRASAGINMLPATEVAALSEALRVAFG